MAGKKDADWWREYRRKKKAEQSPHATPTKTPVSQPLDTSSAAVSIATDGTPEMHAHAEQIVTDWRAKLLAAPNDDCAGCGHDRQSFHLDGSCRAPVPHTKGRRCGCETFIDPAEPF